MEAKAPTVLAYAAAWVAVPIVYAVVAQASYYVGRNGGPWPSVSYWFSIWAVLIASGTWVVHRQLRLQPPWNILFCGVYILFMFVLIAVVHLAVACGNGDCF